MTQSKFTITPTFKEILSFLNGIVDDIAGKAASSHNHSAANITSGTLPLTRGGTGLTAAPSMLTNLGSTAAASPLQASPRPGVTGTLPLGNGGTGATTAAAALKALIGSTAIGSSTKPMYYDGSALKACADSIGGGGIIAALLEQNGYVKFANGLILQWGIIETTRGTVPTITFPMAHTLFAAPMIIQTRCSSGDGFIFGIAQDSITLTGFSTQLDRFATAGSGTPQKIIWHSFGV